MYTTFNADIKYDEMSLEVQNSTMTHARPLGETRAFTSPDIYVPIDQSISKFYQQHGEFTFTNS